MGFRKRPRLLPIIGGLSLFLVSCAGERTFKPVVANGKRIAKASLQGTFSYLRSVKDVKYAKTSPEFLAPGVYLDTDKLVQFVIRENTLDVVSVDPLYIEEKDAEINQILLSFPIRHVDLLRKQNVDGEDTHEEEETEARRTWSQRDYVVVDLTQNKVDLFAEVKSTGASPSIEIDATAGTINFETAKQLKEGVWLEEHYSFLKFTPSATYEQRLYPRPVQDRFGIFKTVTYKFDNFGRRLQSLKQEFMSRWDTTQPVVYYLSKNFPQHLKPATYAVFAAWNQAFRSALGKDLLELRENSGQELGDLRYSLIGYVDTAEENGLLGYGPSVVNPRTGEILKGDVYVYGNTLKHAIWAERAWGKLLGVGMRGLPLGSITPKSTSPTKIAALASQLTSLRAIDLSLIETVKTRTENPAAMIETLRERFYKENTHRLTRMNADVGTAIRANVGRDMTDEELEIAIFTPLIAHELGHTLGLRHNFMGSADENHFHPGKKSSSVMDYGFFSTVEPEGPGPYDSAAIQIAYGTDRTKDALLTAENFYYCTDENLFDARHGLCHQFDAGTNLSQVARKQIERYVASFYFNNLRLDRVGFGEIDQEYVDKVLTYLIDLRLLFDHATSVVNAGKLAEIRGGGAPDEEGLKKLWRLLRRRIEAGRGSQRIFPLEITSALTVRIDLDKAIAALEDADKARHEIFSYFSLTITEQDRNEYHQVDIVNEDLQIRGVLIDKLLALMVLNLRTIDPLGDAGGISVFDTLHEPAAALLTSLLSNTETGKSAEGRIVSNLKVFNTNLREMAFESLKQLIEDPGLESGEAKELVRLERVRANDPEAQNLQKLDELRAQFQELLYKFEVTTDPDEEARFRAEVQVNMDARNALNLTSCNIRDGLQLKAPITLTEFGAVDTASGHLIRDNLNLMEDRLAVLIKVEQDLSKLINGEEDPEKRKKLQREADRMKDMQLIFTRYVKTERSFAEKLYREYRPN